jgi:hypothetical protein
MLLPKMLQQLLCASLIQALPPPFPSMKKQCLASAGQFDLTKLHLFIRPEFFISELI